jgi:hypothetical protein
MDAEARNGSLTRSRVPSVPPRDRWHATNARNAEGFGSQKEALCRLTLASNALRPPTRFCEGAWSGVIPINEGDLAQDPQF